MVGVAPSGSSGSSGVDLSFPNSAPQPPVRLRAARRCSVCNQTGHNKNHCPQNIVDIFLFETAQVLTGEFDDDKDLEANSDEEDEDGNVDDEDAEEGEPELVLVNEFPPQHH